MNAQISKPILDSWNMYVNSVKKGLQNQYEKYLMDFLSSKEDIVIFLKHQLYSDDRNYAFGVIEHLKEEDKKKLFKDIVYFTSFSHGATLYFRNIIKGLPRKWVVNNIEEIINGILENGTYDEYRRVLELYIELDDELTKKVAIRAIHHEDLDIKEAGEDFLQKYQGE
ncbi:MAG: hypothetical protein OEY93_08445 [Anaerolineae bacterium]|nr:hypothetical protein [Anaerolineae bacterium]